MSPVDTQKGRPEAAATDRHELEVRELAVAGFDGPLAGRLYRAAADGRRDLLIVFFHGGGFVDGNLDEADGFLRRLAVASGYPVVLSSTYTLAPVKPFPAAVEDAHAVLRAVVERDADAVGAGGQVLGAEVEQVLAVPGRAEQAPEHR